MISIPFPHALASAASVELQGAASVGLGGMSSGSQAAFGLKMFKALSYGQLYGQLELDFGVPKKNTRPGF